MTAYEKPAFRLLPEPEDANVPYWTGGENDELLIMHCDGCGHYFHPPAPVCWRCRSLDVAPKAVSGRGRIASFTINVQTWLPTMPPPYVVVLVDLEEEPDTRVFSQLVDVDPQSVAIGDEVQVFFEHWKPEKGAEVWLPLFRRVEA